MPTTNPETYRPQEPGKFYVSAYGTPYGDKGCLVRTRHCGPKCPLPGCNRVDRKFTGQINELELDLSVLGPYTPGGFDLSQLMSELGVGQVTGAMQNSSWDLNGCKKEFVFPYVLQFCLEDRCRPKLQVFGPEGEVAEGTVMPDTLVCVALWVC